MVTETRRVSLFQGLVDFVIHQEVIKVETPSPGFIDITDRVVDLVQNTGLDLGTILLFSKHTTAALVLQEQESGLMVDFAKFQERLAPREIYYAHNDFAIRTENMNADESPNGHSHCLHLVMSSSIHIPVSGGAMDLGTWQRIFLVELDSPRPREVVIQVWGLAGVKGTSNVEAPSG